MAATKGKGRPEPCCETDPRDMEVKLSKNCSVIEEMLEKLERLNGELRGVTARIVEKVGGEQHAEEACKAPVERTVLSMLGEEISQLALTLKVLFAVDDHLGQVLGDTVLANDATLTDV